MVDTQENQVNDDSEESLFAIGLANCTEIEHQFFAGRPMGTALATIVMLLAATYEHRLKGKLTTVEEMLQDLAPAVKSAVAGREQFIRDNPHLLNKPN